MKKSLLLLAAAAFAGAANAQVIVTMASNEDFENVGLSGTKTTMGPLDDIVSSEAGSFGLAYEDSWGTTTAYKDYQNVTVNGEAVTLGSGAVGNSNPTFVSFEAGYQTAGAVFKIHSNMNGYMTVFTKLNPNKQYLVFEGTTGDIVYSLGWTNGTQKIYYAMPDDGEGYINVEAPDADKYLVPATKQSKNEAGVLLWERSDTHEIVAAEKKPTVPEGETYKWNPVTEVIPGQTKPAMPWNVAGLDKAPGESTGFLSFPVYADCDYYFSALGSKAACGGFVFTEEAPSIVFEACDVTDKEGNVTHFDKVEFPAILGDGAAVEAVEAANDANAPIYNLMGVRVNSDAKGLLIQNGKKFIRK